MMIIDTMAIPFNIFFLKRCLLVFLLSVFFISCKKDKEEPLVSVDRLELLTGGSAKNWNISEVSRHDDDPSCDPSHELTRDNTWTFKSDYSLIFDHGTVTEIEGGRCSDMINFTGSFKFLDNQSKLQLLAHFVVEGEEDEVEELGTYDIQSFTEDKLVLSAWDERYSENNLMIFRPK